MSKAEYLAKEKPTSTFYNFLYCYAPFRKKYFKTTMTFSELTKCARRITLDMLGDTETAFDVFCLLMRWGRLSEEEVKQFEGLLSNWELITASEMLYKKSLSLS